MEVVDGGLLDALVCVLLLSEPLPRRNGRVVQHPLEVPAICKASRNPYSPDGIQPALQSATSEETGFLATERSEEHRQLAC